ncbi:MAG TPA: response regulator transcription factor [Polyangia bacterium]|jgi:DNA-binding response OmpR family regulator|nr:response regulator transcription factor [Polyangia bacterium]
MSAPAGEPAPGPMVMIVEDDAAIAAGLALNLKLQGYRYEVAADGETAHERITATAPALVLLDISLPKQSGLWVLERLREAGDHVPVIVLSARQDEFDKVAALKLGADDYVTKPFALAELLARVAAVLRRARQVAMRADSLPAGESTATAAPGGKTTAFGEVVIDLDARSVTRRGAPVRLTHLEFQLLTFFCRSRDKVFSREELLRAVWGMQNGCTLRTVDNFVGQLRAKLEADPDRPRFFVTVRGSGYKFTAPERAD